MQFYLSTVAKLPAELTDRVIDFLHSDKRALAACSLVCKSWIPASRYHLFREINITPVNSQSFSDIFESVTTKIVTGFNEQPPSLILGKSKVPRGTEFSSYVRRVSWTVKHEGEWLTCSIMQIISSLPLLSEFYVTRSGRTSCPPFGLLKGIKKFLFKGHLLNAVSEIATAIANSPELEYLDISRGKFYDRMGDTTHVREFFARIPPGSPPLKLQHLGVGEIHLGLDATIVPHIRSLTSLGWFRPWGIGFGGCKESSKEIWKILRSERISLSRLKTSVMNDEFLEFLSSSQGISELRLESITGGNVAHPNPFARTFFHVVLPGLAVTLKVLRIDAGYEGDWCFKENNLDFILNCTNLEELAISLYWPEQLESSDSAPVDLLLNHISQLPNLRFLEILPAMKTSYHYNPFEGVNPVIKHQKQLDAKILSVVERFEKLVGDDFVGSPGYELCFKEKRMFVPRT